MINNKKIYIVLSVFALASLFLIVFFICPLLKEIKKNSEELISAKNDIIAFSVQYNETEKFKENYEKYKPDLEKINRLFVDFSNPVDLIEFLEVSALGSRLTSQISLVSSPANSKQNNQDFITLRIVCSGSFLNILNFSKKIETGRYLIEIENLSIQSLQDGKINAAFTIKAFTKK